MQLLLIAIVFLGACDDAELFNKMCSHNTVMRIAAFIRLSALIRQENHNKQKTDLNNRIRDILTNRAITEVNGVLHWRGSKASYEYCLIQLLNISNSNDSIKSQIDCICYSAIDSAFASERAWSIDYAYPVTGMLLRKGQRIVPMLVDSLASTIEDGRHRRNCCWVLQKLLGNEKCLNVIDATLPKLDKYRSRSLEQCKVYFRGGEIMPNPSGTVSKYYNIN